MTCFKAALFFTTASLASLRYPFRATSFAFLVYSILQAQPSLLQIFSAWQSSFSSGAFPLSFHLGCRFEPYKLRFEQALAQCLPLPWRTYLMEGHSAVELILAQFASPIGSHRGGFWCAFAALAYAEYATNPARVTTCYPFVK